MAARGTSQHLIPIISIDTLETLGTLGIAKKHPGGNISTNEIGDILWLSDNNNENKGQI